MYIPGRNGVLKAPTDWKAALDLPGANQLRHLRHLMESRPFLTRIPDQNVLLSGPGQATDHMQATCDGSPGKKDATYIMVYTPVARFPEIDTSVIPGKKLHVWWYDPREGTAIPLGEVENEGTYKPGWNQQPWKPGAADWVLVIDDATKEYPRPGVPLCTK